MTPWNRCTPRGAAMVLLLGIVAARAVEAHVVGIEFIDAPTFSPFITPVPMDNFDPYLFTDPNNNFSAHGALQGVTETELRENITTAIQQIFRRAEIGMPNRMLNVDIRLGAVTPAEGTVQQIGGTIFVQNSFGLAYPTGAITRPDLQPNPYYSNALGVTLANVVDQIPVFDPSVTFQTQEQVVQAIAGTSAHEIAHTLNVWNHVPGQPVNGVYPIMGTGPTNLPLAARLDERRLMDLPNTQYQFPIPIPPSGPLIYSVTETLLNAVGTTSVADFNFDGVVDGADFGIWNANKFRVGTGVKTGDANDDGVTDGSDFNVWNAFKFGGLAAAADSFSAAGPEAGPSFGGSVMADAVFVPEPCTGLLWLELCLLLRTKVRRGQKAAYLAAASG